MAQSAPVGRRAGPAQAGARPDRGQAGLVGVRMKSLKELVEHRLAPQFEPGTWEPACVLCNDSGWETYKDAQNRLWARKCVCRGSTPCRLENAPQEFAGALLEAFQRTAANVSVVQQVEQWLP